MLTESGQDDLNQDDELPGSVPFTENIYMCVNITTFRDVNI
jgi:hypothetical protein